MSPDLSAAERAYRRLKREILEGFLGAGPLDIGGLGDRLRMSATPVREALARLRAEHLVHCSPHHGYAIAPPSPRQLQHLYQLNGALLDLSLQLMQRDGSGTPASTTDARASDYAVGLTMLLDAIGASQPNLELSARITETGDRLFSARRCEPAVFLGAAETLSALMVLWERQNVEALRSLIRTHHAARIAAATALAQILSDKFGESSP